MRSPRPETLPVGLPAPSGRAQGSTVTAFDRGFLAAIALLYVTNLALTPPFQAPDEPNHFLRAYQLSTGCLWGETGVVGIPEVETRRTAGGHVPAVVHMDSARFSDLAFHPERQVDAGRWRSEMRASGSLTPDRARGEVFSEFRNTVLYPPVAYGPAVLGILASRALGLTVLEALYVSRAAYLLVCLLLLYGTLRVLGPGEKRKLGILCLAGMPMTAFLVPSVNGDALSISLSFLVVGLGLRLGDAWSDGRFAAFLAATALLALCKPPTFFVALMVLPAVASSDATRSVKALRLLLVGVSSLGLAVLWESSVAHLVTPFRYDLNGDQTVRDQLAFFLANPLRVSAALAHEFFVARLREYWASFIGILGWLDTPIHPWATRAYSVLLAVVALLGTISDRGDDATRPWSRFWNAAVVMGCIYLVLLGNYLAWSKIGSYEVEGVQGRHFIPAAGLLLLSTPTLVRLSRGRYSLLKGAIVATWAVVSGAAVASLLARYWGVRLL